MSDNAPCYHSRGRKDFLEDRHLRYIRFAPDHPMNQGKIERYHRSIKNEVKLRNYEYPWELEQAIEAFVEYYHHKSYQEALDNLTPADVFSRKSQEALTHREQIKDDTLRKRKRFKLKLVLV